MAGDKLKKILIFHHSDGFGGAGISLLITAVALKDIYNVVIYLPHINTKLGAALINEGIEVKSVEDNVGIIDSFSGGPPTFSKAFVICLAKIIIHTYSKYRKVIHSEQPDLVIVNSMTLSWIGPEIKKNGLKSVCFVRETAVDNLGMKLIYKNLNSYFDGVAFISEYDKRKFHCKAPHQSVIPDTVIKSFEQNSKSTVEIRHKLNLEENFFYVLFAGGTNVYPKGWEVIRDAMAYLTSYRIKLLVTGTVDDSRKVLRDNIIYLGLQTDMSELYSACDVLVFPSIAPHQARPAYEAGFKHRPVIISDYEETQEYVIDEYNGLTFFPGDCCKLSACILRLYNDRNLCEYLGKNNYMLACQKHGYLSCNELLLTFIQNVLKE